MCFSEEFQDSFDGETLLRSLSDDALHNIQCVGTEGVGGKHGLDLQSLRGATVKLKDSSRGALPARDPARQFPLVVANNNRTYYDYFKLHTGSIVGDLLGRSLPPLTDAQEFWCITQKWLLYATWAPHL